MLRALKIVLMALGCLFILQLLTLLYVIVADPFHVRPLISLLWQPQQTTPVVSPITVDATPVSPPVAVKATTTVSKTVPVPATAPAMTPTQRNALQSVGIDPNSFSHGITAAQLTCFTGILGAPRVAEIKAGAVPTAAEFFSVRRCL